MKAIILAMLLVTSGTAFATPREFTVDKQYVWTITDTPCVALANPDLLNIKQATVHDLQTGATAPGCALDDGTNIEFQMLLDDTRSIQLSFPSKLFHNVESF